MPVANPFVEAIPVEILRARAEAALWVRKQMARHGLSLADLKAAGCFAVRGRHGHRDSAKNLPPIARYRSASGENWDGVGEMPDWLQRAVNAGQNVEHFRVG